MRKCLIDSRGKRTQEEAAKHMGISQKYLSKLELGKRNPSLPTASRIGKYYQKPVEELFPDIFLE